MEEVCFFMSVYDQHVDAEEALAGVRENYPSSRIFLFSGGKSMGFDDLARKFGAEGIETSNLHLACYGGTLWRMVLECFLMKPADHLIKIDPDTRCHRRIQSLPPTDFVWGHLQACEPEGYSHIQGGCKGTGVMAARKLLENKAFDDPSLSDPSTYCGPERLASLRHSGLGCEDRYTQKAYEKAGIMITHCPEVYSIYRGLPLAGRNHGYAFTHPHKTC